MTTDLGRLPGQQGPLHESGQLLRNPVGPIQTFPSPPRRTTKGGSHAPRRPRPDPSRRRPPRLPPASPSPERPRASRRPTARSSPRPTTPATSPAPGSCSSTSATRTGRPGTASRRSSPARASTSSRSTTAGYGESGGKRHLDLPDDERVRGDDRGLAGRRGRRVRVPARAAGSPAGLRRRRRELRRQPVDPALAAAPGGQVARPALGQHRHGRPPAPDAPSPRRPSCSPPRTTTGASSR